MCSGVGKKSDLREKGVSVQYSAWPIDLYSCSLGIFVQGCVGDKGGPTEIGGKGKLATGSYNDDECGVVL